MSQEIEHERTSNIVCPYCGYEDECSYEHDDDNGQTECGSCGETFNFERHIDVEWSTTKQSCTEKGEVHSYKLRAWHTPYIYSGKNWTIYHCEKCDDEVIKTAPIAENGEPFTIPLDSEDLE